MLYHDSNQTAYPLERVLKRARDECEPTASIRQVRRWFNFWVDFAETPVELKKKNNQLEIVAGITISQVALFALEDLDGTLRIR